MTRPADSGEARPPMPAAGRISRIEVENFKSYRGFQVVGPMRDFTAVIGPNGAGKSNLMDAISFVLGVRSQHLRGNLRELLYSHADGADGTAPDHGMVRLVFEREPGRETVFERRIHPASSSGADAYASSYKIDGRTVSAETYTGELESLGVLVRAKNFLVFQGDIESVASKTPKEITALVEQISGSDLLRRDYEAAEARKQEADARQMLLFSRKRTVLAEKRQKREQKEEAEKHLSAQKELRALQQEYALWQIHVAVRQLADVRAARAELIEEQKANARRLVAKEAEVAELDKEAARQKKAVVVARKKLASKQAEADKHRPAVAHLQERVARLQKATKQERKRAAELAGAREEIEGQIASLRDDAAKIEKLQREFEDGVARDQDGAALALDAEQLAEYNRCKGEVGAQTVTLRHEIDRLEAEQKTKEEAVSRLASNAMSINSRRHTLTAKQKDGEDRLAKLREQVEKSQAAYAQAQASLRKVQEDLSATSRKRSLLTADLDRVEAQIRDARAMRKESEKDKRKAEAVKSMQGAINGVHGRLADLGKVTERQFRLALTMAMNKDMDSVVVENEEAAKQCIQFLKDERVPPMTFIPLASIAAKPANEQLRTLGDGTRLAIDCIEFDAKFERAFLYALGDFLVADTIEAARALAYGPERHKVVSLDGTIFNKSGTITGGMSSDVQARAARWDDQALEALKTQREKLRSQLDALPSERALQAEERALEAEARAAQESLTGATADARALEERLAGVEAELRSLNEERERTIPELTGARAAVDAIKRRIQAVKAEMDAKSDQIFAEFSAKMGVASVREYEETRLKRQTEVAETRAAYKTQLSKVASNLEYQESRLAKTVEDLGKREAVVATNEEALRKANAELKEAEGQLRALEAAVAEVQATAEEAQAQANDAAKRMADVKRDVAAIDREVKAAMGQVRDKEERASDLEAVIAQTVQQAQMDNVELPRRAGGETETEKDGEAADGAAGDTAYDYDFGRVRRQYLNVPNRARRDAIDKEFKDSIASVAQQLDQMAPNLKAMEQYEAVKRQEREHNELLDKAKEEAREATAEFERVHQQRLALFTDAFDHISRSIDAIYKELTRSDVHPLGGMAYLSLESPDDPFNGGIKYTAMPPSKRFREMEQLSGGEKTVAALALLFAVHSHRPSPFFILDEIDAALDASNIARVAQYIRQRSRGQWDGCFQAIVISLKDVFFDKADALLGVTKNLEQQSSRVLTFDLSAFLDA